MSEHFLFKKPEVDDGVSRSTEAMVCIAALTQRLQREKRTRCYNSDGSRENVAEHTLMLSKVAVALAEQNSDLDSGSVALYALQHDDLEAYVGDTPTGLQDNADFATKAELEAAGLKQLVADFHPHTPVYSERMERYEQQQDREARFVRMVDKVVVTLLRYVNDQGELLREKFPTKESFLANEQAAYDRFNEEYADWIEVLDLRREIANMVVKKYYTP